ncbi:hypothetical protein [Shewanella sp. 10N.286.54.B9]|uniref:hypothetical protein n=1 Tax=Shewanella sp. 10N.286.54.B9 TaxID=3229719 RepID=UPI00354E925E
MSTQQEKYHKGMSGEYAVASELHRRNISAAVTFGNYKSADVIAFNSSSDRTAIIEVKTTSNPKWVVGGSPIPERSDRPWVFVHMPSNLKQPPRYFILLQHELHDLLKPIEDEYYKKYEVKHGKPYGDKSGVVNFSLHQAEQFEDQWEKIHSILTGK